MDERPGLIIFKVDGRGADEAFADEAGGHRWQRVPPTEKRGRVHTSTVTVVVLPVPSEVDLAIPPGDLRWSTCRGSGAGGQHRNVTDSACQVTHLPSGTSVRCESERSQHRNRQTALELLRARLLAVQRAERAEARHRERMKQAGSGMRGDKRRTIRVQDGVVTDHVLKRRWRLKDYLRGDW